MQFFRRYSWLALAMAVLLVTLAPKPVASAAPAPDPPLTYRLTVYDHDSRGLVTRELAPEGTRITVYATPFARSLLGLSQLAKPCADVYVDSFGHAEIVVEITADCPVGLCVSIEVAPPGRPVTAASDPPMVWRRAYSEATTVVDLVVRPKTAPTSAVVRPPLPVMRLTGEGDSDDCLYQRRAASE